MGTNSTTNDSEKLHDGGSFAQERAAATKARSPHLQYNDRLTDLARMIDDMMRRRAGVANTIYGLYTSPDVGGACILSKTPRVTRGTTGELRFELLGGSDKVDGDEEPAVDHRWPVTHLTVYEPHNVAVLVTPLDVFVMQASELFAQLAEAHRG